MERSVIRDRPFPDCAEFIIGPAEGRTWWLHPGYSFHQAGSGGCGPSGTMPVGLSALIE
jgi:hypothetical protein